MTRTPETKEGAVLVDDDLNARAARIFGVERGVIRWPYGLDTPSRWDFRNDTTDERYQMFLARAQEGQRIIVEWAEQYGVKPSRVKCCPIWLHGKMSRRCPPGTCYYEGSSDRWLDHRVMWLREGRPVALTSAPYHLNDGDRERIAWWVAQSDRLRAAYGTGWYGLGSSQVLLWRADRIADMAAA